MGKRNVGSLRLLAPGVLGVVLAMAMGPACKPTFLSPTSSSTSGSSATPTPSASASSSASSGSSTSSTALATLLSVSPSSGSSAGGTTITLTGTGFLTGATVDVGGSACTSVTRVSQTELQCVTPAHAAGTVAVSVTNPGASPVSLAGAFTYTASGPTGWGWIGAYSQFRTWMTGGVAATGFQDGFLQTPHGAAIDSAGQFAYVVDQGGHRVQKFNIVSGSVVGSIGNSNATGSCSAGAQSGWCLGGMFSSATGDGMFSSPRSIAIHPSNTFIYVADTSNSRIQRFNATTGAFAGAIGGSTASGTCVLGPQTQWCTGGSFSAGIGDGQFNGPWGLGVDPGGSYLYVADTGNQRVQRFNLATAAFAGAIGFNSAGGGNCSVGAQTIWCTGGMGASWASGASDGRFNNPVALAADTSYLYVVEQTNYRVQRFNLAVGSAAGAIGNNTAVGPCPVGMQSSWCSGGTFATGPTDGQFNVPGGIAAPAGGFLYVSDNARVQKFNASTAVHVGSIGYASSATGGCANGVQPTWCTGGTTFVGDSVIPGAMYSGRNPAFYPDGSQFLAIAYNVPRLQRFNTATGAFTGALGAISSESGNSLLQTGWTPPSPIGVPISGTGDGALSGPLGVAVSSDGGLLVADTNHHQISKFNASTGAFIGAIGNSSAAGTCAAGAQTGWCTGGTFASGTSDGRFSSPVGVAASTNGYFLTVDSSSYRVQKFNASTGAFIGAIGSASGAAGTCAAGVQTAGWCAGGTFTANPAAGGFNNAAALAIDTANQFFYVSDISSNNISKFNFATGVFVAWIGKASSSVGNCTAGAQSAWCNGAATFTSGSLNGELWTARSLAVDTQYLYVSEQSNVRLQRFNLSTGAFAGKIGGNTGAGDCAVGAQTAWCTGAGSVATANADGQFQSPSGMTLHPTQDYLYISDTVGGRVQKFVRSTGAFVGTMGRVNTAAGTCVAGGQSSWCTGGTFAPGSTEGMFNQAFGLATDSTGSYLYIAESTNSRIQRLTGP